jgi:hypothetical protein
MFRPFRSPAVGPPRVAADKDATGERREIGAPVLGRDPRNIKGVNLHV